MPTLDRFLQERAPSWGDLDALVREARGRPERLGAARVRRLGALYRAAAADLAWARRRYPGDPAVVRLEELVGRARHAVYSGDTERRSVRAFLLTDYWRRVAERPLALALSALLLFAPLVLSAWWAHDDPGAASGLVPGAWAAVSEPRPDGADLGLTVSESTAFSTEIFVNNIQVAFMAFAGGLALGLLTAAALLYNGTIIGAITGLAVAAGNTSVFVQLIVPHGVLELSCIVVAGAAGLRLGWAIVDPGRVRRSVALAAEARRSVELAVGTALWLVVAGIVEGFVTPAGIGVGPALVVGFGLGALYWALVVTRGRVTAAPGPST